MMSHLGLLILEFAFVLIKMFLLFCLWVHFIWVLLNVRLCAVTLCGLAIVIWDF